MWSGNIINNCNPVACIGCLATDVKLSGLNENNLAESYVELIGISLEGHFPQHLCVFCRSLLAKFRLFREKCLRTHSLLIDAEYQGRSITPETLREISNWYYKPKYNEKTITDANEHIESEVEEKLNIELKQEKTPEEPSILYFKEDKSEENDDSANENDVVEPLEIFADDCVDVDNPKVIPKKRIKKDKSYQPPKIKRRVRKVKIKNDDDDEDVPIKKVKKERKPKASKSADAIKNVANSQEFDVIFLTREEQLEEIEERRQAALKLKNSIKCKFCGKNYQNQERLDAHFNFYHAPSVGNLVCEFCQCRFKARHKLSHHLRIHLVRFSCRNCTFQTKRESTLKRHFEWHQGKRHVCQYCNKDFAKISSYLSHVRLIHAAELPWCELCGDSFIGEKGVQAHKKLSHKGIDMTKHVCTNCKTSFVDANALNKHTNQTSCDLANCVQCGDGFASQQVLKYHLVQKHRVEGSHGTDCESCGVRFHNTIAFQRHLCTCGARYVCVQCGLHFADEGPLKAHEADDHSAEDVFKCQECNKTFPNAFYFREHCNAHFKNKSYPSKKQRRGQRRLDPSLRKWRVVGEEAADVVMEKEAPQKTDAKKGAMCEVCGKSFQNAGLLKYHQRIHSGERPFHCTQCSKSFTTNRLLEEHLRVHTGERPYKCANCPKAFKTLAALNRHNLVHNGLRRHVCQLCDKTFQTSSCAKVHIKTVHMKLPTPPRVRRRRVKDE